MQKIREYNEKESLKLDECFKESLVRIRPYILGLTSTESAQLCRVWLHKLYTASSQRRLRNEYLVELWRQLKTGRIGGIFSRPPPNGYLLPLPKSYHMVCISSSVSDPSDYVMKSHRSFIKPSAKCMQHKRSKALTKHRMPPDITNMKHCLYAVDLSPTVRFHDQKLEAENDYLRNQLTEYSENCKDDYLSTSINKLTTDVTTLKAKLSEMQKLKHSIEESYKETVQEYHLTVVEKFTELKQQLNETLLKNKALENSVAVISKKMDEITHGKVRSRNFVRKARNTNDILKGEETKAMEQRWTDKIKTICERFDSFTREKNKELQLKQDLLNKKDMELCKKDAGRKEEIELFTNKIHDLEMKLETKIRDEDKLQGMIVEQYAIMKEEFNKMRNEMDHETQKQNQDLMSKVSALKKAVVKLEKSKEKLEYDYEKKLSHIIKNKDMEIKALRLRLQEQKNELSTSLITKKQSEVENIVSTLEKRYRTLLAETEVMSETQTQEYLRKIAILEDQVHNMKKF
ncbi:hypothetical protein ANTPLA_LOCUS3125 [Anthophora plagiata]